jgi:ArsR family transcriptional regulator
MAMTKEPELSLDELLAVLGNPLRREILSRIAQETHYPLQLSKELGVSQQAIMKHLQILRKYHLVQCTDPKSNTLGPPRKCYESTGQFSIRIDFGPSALETQLIRVKARPEEASAGLETEFQRSLELEGAADRLRGFRDTVSKINQEVESLEDRRMALIALKQQILKQASAEIAASSPDYRQRRMLFLITENPSTPADDMARMLNIQREALSRLLRDFFDEGF